MAEQISAALRRASAQLSSSSSARLDAELLLAHVLNWPRSRLFARSDEALDEAQAQAFAQLLGQRQDGVPIAYLLGQQEFWSLPLKVSADCLVPRPETEDLVAWALSQAPDDCRALDLGTGSGAIAIALAHERPNWRITATDSSPAALVLARNNANQHSCRIEWLSGSWFEPLHKQSFDLILSNPPYLAADDPHLPDLRHEPRRALVADQDGLADLQHITEMAPSHLKPGGLLALEHGMAQGALVRELLNTRGFTDVATQTDLAGLERFSHGRWAGSPP